MARILTKLKDLYIQTRGFHTKRHLLIMESDDWGSIRMPSKEVFDTLRKEGDNPQDDAFLSNDCLEHSEDLENLFDVLQSVTDSKGNPAVVTANFVMANPDFDKIDYLAGKYEYEPFFETYKKYYPDNDVLSTIKKGIKLGIFYPQLHCREHLNVNRWMRDLKNGKADSIQAFRHKMIGVGKSFSPDNPFGYMDSFNTDSSTSGELSDILKTGSLMFKQMFGYESKSFVASCFVWSKGLERSMSTVGIRAIQSGPWQLVPRSNQNTLGFQRRIHYTGQKNHCGQIYTVRNCSFEPAYKQNPREAALECIDKVRKAFKAHKPAVIDTHRFNYIGSIKKDNAKNNLEALRYVLGTLSCEFKDLEFISTAQLVDIILGNK